MICLDAKFFSYPKIVPTRIKIYQFAYEFEKIVQELLNRNKFELCTQMHREGHKLNRKLKFRNLSSI